MVTPQQVLQSNSPDFQRGTDLLNTPLLALSYRMPWARLSEPSMTNWPERWTLWPIELKDGHRE